MTWGKERRPGHKAEPSANVLADNAENTANRDGRQRGELAVMHAGPGVWWVHEWDAHHDSGQIVSSHRTKRAAVRAAYSALPDYPGHVVEVWGDRA